MNVISPQTKTAIVLFNLGGPDSLQAVKPFLVNLFNDPAIIGLPGMVRRPLAKFIASRREEEAKEIYATLGGKSPIVENTAAQARALETALLPHGNAKVFFAMRYWHPFAQAVVQEVKTYQPDSIILLPLYPQFSTTTTGSFMKEWERAARACELNVPTKTICCYPTEEHFIAAHAELIRAHYDKASRHGAPRILFSAHGLPEKIIKKGDPYQAQVEATTQAVIATLNIPNLDYVNCYQSRVGPLKWIGPATSDEIIRAAKGSVPIVLVPIAFVSEHSETLVELDVEYKALASAHGMAHYFRVPTLSVTQAYIDALKSLCLNVSAPLASHTGDRLCDKQWSQCPCSA